MEKPKDEPSSPEAGDGSKKKRGLHLRKKKEHAGSGDEDEAVPAEAGGDGTALKDVGSGKISSKLHVGISFLFFFFFFFFVVLFPLLSCMSAAQPMP